MPSSVYDKELLEQFGRLGPAQQREVLEFAKELAAKTPRGTPGQELARFAGCIGESDLAVMSYEIEAACEQVRHDES